MAGILQHLRSSTLDKRPNPGSMVDGQVAINYASGSPGLFFKDSAGALVKVGPVHVGTTAPNVSPASGGTAGNSRGEQWLDTSGGSYVMKIWDGSAWRTEAGEFVNATGDIMTGALGMPPASAGSPTIYFSGDTDTGLYSPGANQLAITTSGTGRLFVASDGKVGIGTAFPRFNLSLGTDASISTATPDAIDLGGTYSNTAGQNLKLRLYWDANTTVAGLGISSGSVDYVTFANGAHTFYASNQERLRITSTGALNFTGAGTAGVTQAVSFNGSAPVNSLVIDSTGNVGIGTSSPSEVLDTVGNIQIRSNAVSGSPYLVFNSKEGSGGVARTCGQIQAIAEAIDGWGLGFYTRTNATPITEKLRITNDGKVGIGTQSPASLLTSYPGNVSTLGAKASTGLLVENNGSAGNISQIGLGYTFSGTYHPVAIAAITDSGSGSTRADLHFATRSLTTDSAPDTRMIIKADGKVGIGTSSPDSKLQVAGNGATTHIGNTYNFDGFYAGASSNNGGGKIEFVAHSSVSTSNSWRLMHDTDSAVGVLSFSYATNASAYGSLSYSEKMRIDNTGRLLLGTSTVTNNLRLEQSLAVVRTGSGYGGMSLTSYIGTTAGNCPILDFQRSRGTTDGSLTKVQTDDRLGVIAFRGANGTTFSDGALIDCWADGEWNTSGDTSDSPGRLSFWTTPDGSDSPEERMRIDKEGRIGVNGINSTQQFAITHNGRDGLAISDTNGSSAQANLLFSNTRAGGTANYYILGYANAVVTFIVYSNGNVQNTNNSYGAISDLKLKENIVNANSQWNDIKALQVRNYNFKEGQTHTQIGLVAQEVELVSPGLVTESPDRDAEGNDLGTVTKSVNYSVLYMKAVKALQEAMERIETLEAKVAALESA